MCGQPVSALGQIHSINISPYVWLEALVFHFMPFVSGSVTRHHRIEPVCLLYTFPSESCIFMGFH